MTVKEANELLAKPIFGDPRCIQAVKVLEEETEAGALRGALLGKRVECWCCEGSGQIRCKALCEHECPTCEGDDKLTLTQKILADLVLYQLRDLAKELERTRYVSEEVGA